MRLATAQIDTAEESPSSLKQPAQNAPMEDPDCLGKVRACNEALRSIFQLERGEYYVDPRKDPYEEGKRVRRLPDMAGQYPG